MDHADEQFIERNAVLLSRIGMDINCLLYAVLSLVPNSLQVLNLLRLLITTIIFSECDLCKYMHKISFSQSISSTYALQFNSLTNLVKQLSPRIHMLFYIDVL